MSEQSTNPYASPVAEDSADESVLPQVTRGTPAQIAAWLGAIAVNLPVPAMFGLIVARDAAATSGMAAGVVAVAVAGAIVTWAMPQVGRLVTRGGYLFALTQLMPIAHAFAGMMGLTIAGRLNGIPFDNDDNGPFVENFLPALVATLTTAGILVALASVIGLLIWSATPRKRKTLHHDY